jgi:hypothetical protein
MIMAATVNLPCVAPHCVPGVIRSKWITRETAIGATRSRKKP